MANTFDNFSTTSHHYHFWPPSTSGNHQPTATCDLRPPNTSDKHHHSSPNTNTTIGAEGAVEVQKQILNQCHHLKRRIDGGAQVKKEATKVQIQLWSFDSDCGNNGGLEAGCTSSGEDFTDPVTATEPLIARSTHPPEFALLLKSPILRRHLLIIQVAIKRLFSMLGQVGSEEEDKASQ
ncbi:unnamed protein product [Lactuca saligna]|uniref:Uncharacterized protein n=1 Tax=Lactuca saligna TaxID=75948 RepID=A0AA35ZSL9_LACSI|nr:unnamed protein product [Lactuca saligna]